MCGLPVRTRMLRVTFYVYLWDGRRQIRCGVTNSCEASSESLINAACTNWVCATRSFLQRHPVRNELNCANFRFLSCSGEAPHRSRSFFQLGGAQDKRFALSSPYFPFLHTELAHTQSHIYNFSHLPSRIITTDRPLTHKHRIIAPVFDALLVLVSRPRKGLD